MTRLEWNEDLLKHVLPQRGHPRLKKNLPRIKAASLYKKAAKLLEAHPEGVKRGNLISSPASAILLKQAATRVRNGEQPPDFEPLAEAATALLSTELCSSSYGPKARHLGRWVGYWIQRFGTQSAVSALLATVQMDLVTTQHSKDKLSWHLLLPGEPKELRGALAFWMDDPWIVLRHTLAYASEAEYSTSKASLIEQTTAVDQPWARVRAAFVLSEEPDFRAEVLRECKTEDGRSSLLTCADSAAEALMIHGNNPNIETDALLTMVHRLGLDAEYVLKCWTPNYGHDKTAWVRAMSVLVGAGPADAILNFFDERGVRVVAGSYFKRHPDLAKTALPKAIQRTKKKAVRDAMKTLLRSIESAETIRDTGPSSETAANTDVLPPVLQQLPWRQKSKKQPTFELTPLDVASKLTASDTELAKRAKPWGPYDDPRKKLEESARDERRGETQVLGQLEDADEMFGFIQKIPRWWAESETLSSVIARVGPRIDPFLPKMITSLEDLEGISDYGAVSLVPFVLAAAHRKKTEQDAFQWMSRFPEHAASGLFPLLLGKDKKQQKRASSCLFKLLSQQHEGTLRNVASRFGASAGPDVQAAILRFIDTPPLDRVPSKIAKPASWLSVEALPALQLTDHTPLSGDSMIAVCEMLAFTDTQTVYAGIEQIRQACSPESRDRFVQALCTAWVAAGAASASTWALYAVGHLGTDDSASWLGKQIHAWAFGGKRARAIAGLAVLAMLGTDLALMLLGQWAHTGPLWLRTEATEHLGRIAKARGLSADELADRSTPTFGLDDDGTLLLDYGTRTITVEFDGSLTPLLFDAEGRRLERIPAIRKTDDKAKATEAKKRWGALKDNAAKLAKGELRRFERAMTSGRRWKPSDFERFVLRHPLIGRLARRLVFGVFIDDTMVSSFRLTYDGELADENDETVDLPSRGEIGVAHPLQLTSTLAKWAGVFIDYEILQPFAQLDRPTTTVGSGDEITAAWQGVSAFSGRLYALRTRGWHLDGTFDAFDSARKVLGGQHEVRLRWDDAISRRNPEKTEHVLRSLTLIKGDSFLDVEPVALSEMLLDIRSLRG